MNDNESRNSIDTLLNAIGDPQSKKVGFSNSVSIKYSKKLKDEKERKAYAKSKIENYTHVLTLSSNTLPPDEADKKAILLLQDNTHLRIYIFLDPGDDKPSVYTINKEEANAIIELAPQPSQSSKNMIKEEKELLIENILEALYDIVKTSAKSTSHNASQSSGANSDKSFVEDCSPDKELKNNELDKLLSQKVDSQCQTMASRYFNKHDWQYEPALNLLKSFYKKSLEPHYSYQHHGANKGLSEDDLKNKHLAEFDKETEYLEDLLLNVHIRDLFTIPDQLYPKNTLVHFMYRNRHVLKIIRHKTNGTINDKNLLDDEFSQDNLAFQKTINLILSILPEEALLWHIDYLLRYQLNIIANMPMEEGANLVNKAFEDLIRGSRFPQHLEKFSDFCQELKENNIHTSHYTQKLSTGSFFFTSKKDLIEKIQWFECLHNAERAAYLIGIILIIMSGLEAGKIMPSLSSSDITYTLVFSLLGCLCLGGGYVHRRYRQIQQKPMDAAVGILSALRNPSFFQEKEDKANAHKKEYLCKSRKRRLSGNEEQIYFNPV